MLYPRSPRRDDGRRDPITGAPIGGETPDDYERAIYPRAVPSDRRADETGPDPAAATPPTPAGSGPDQTTPSALEDYTKALGGLLEEQALELGIAPELLEPLDPHPVTTLREELEDLRREIDERAELWRRAWTDALARALSGAGA